MTATTSISMIPRRDVLMGSAATLGCLLLSPAALAQQRVATPAQSEGPFYPTTFPADVDNDLVMLRGAAARAEGIVTHIGGRVLDLGGKPLAGARIEIWQCDAHGRYLHPGSGGSRPRDPGFQGFGRVTAAADGSYSFRTIRPVPYSGRTPHIHFAVDAGGRRLVTQMYVAGEPTNAKDGLYRSLASRGLQDAVTVRLEPANGVEEGALAGRFDIAIRS